MSGEDMRKAFLALLEVDDNFITRNEHVLITEQLRAGVTVANQRRDAAESRLRQLENTMRYERIQLDERYQQVVTVNRQRFDLIEQLENRVKILEDRCRRKQNELRDTKAENQILQEALDEYIHGDKGPDEYVSDEQPRRGRPPEPREKILKDRRDLRRKVTQLEKALDVVIQDSKILEESLVSLQLGKEHRSTSTIEVVEV